MNVDYQALDWGTVLTRRTSKAPVDAGGWSVFFTSWAGSDMLTPAGHISLRGNGADAWFGWPDAPKIEALRTDWFSAPDAAVQKTEAEALQKQVLTDVPYIPLGQYLQATAYRETLTNVMNGFRDLLGRQQGLNRPPSTLAPAIASRACGVAIQRSGALCGWWSDGWQTDWRPSAEHMAIDEQQTRQRQRDDGQSCPGG